VLWCNAWVEVDSHGVRDGHARFCERTELPGDPALTPTESDALSVVQHRLPHWLGRSGSLEPSPPELLDAPDLAAFSDIEANRILRPHHHSAGLVLNGARGTAWPLGPCAPNVYNDELQRLEDEERANAEAP
jgi:hypothetical protein